MEPRFLKHAGPALVFDDYPHEEGGRRREPRRHRRPRPGAAQRRPAGRPGHAGMGHAAHAEEAPEGGPSRHAAPVGRAHERHKLRRLRAARLAGELHRRAAGAAAHGRHRRASTCEARSIRMACPTEELARRRAAWSRRSRASTAAMAGCSTATSSRPMRAATSTSSRPSSAPPSASRPSTDEARLEKDAMALSSETRDKLKRSAPRPWRPRSTSAACAAVHPGRAAAAASQGEHGRRGLHPALHAGARRPEPARRVPRPRPPAAQGGGGMPAGRGHGHGQPQGRPRRLGGRHPGRPAEGARRGGRGDGWRLPRRGRDRNARHPRLPPTPLGADQPDSAPGDRDQRTDRLRRRAGLPRRRRGGRCGRRHHHPGPPRGRDRRRRRPR